MENKRTIIITGAARGIGAATAAQFAKAGDRLAVTDRDEAALLALGERLSAEGAEVLALPGDLRDDRFLCSIVPAVISRWNRVDVLINNAAWRTHSTMRTMTRENWEATLAVCLTAPAFLSKYAAAAMEEGKAGGVILNVSSVMAGRPGGLSPAYVACKGALESLTYELAVLYGPAGIRVAAVAPGAVDTAIASDYSDAEGNDISRRLTAEMNDLTPLQRASGAEEIAAVLYWLSTPAASFITGACIPVDGGFSHNFSAYRVKRLQNEHEF
ncbi:SDR family NAD(P)-dependent oxidoreductase [Chitinophaga lutea]